MWTVSGEGLTPSIQVCTPAEASLRVTSSSIERARLLSYERGAANQGVFHVMLEVEPTVVSELEMLRDASPESFILITHRHRLIATESMLTPWDYGIPGGIFDSAVSAQRFYEELALIRENNHTT